MNSLSTQLSVEPPMPAKPPLLELHDICVRVSDGPDDRLILDHINLSVARGELVAIMGPSGSGKTTLLSVAAGLAPWDSGEVMINAESCRLAGRLGSHRWRQLVGVVEQRLNLLGMLTAAENVALPLELAGVKLRVALQQARSALAEVGLEERADVRGMDLSGGEQQRVAIARATIGDRQLIVADEPTAALDRVTGERIMALLRLHCDQHGRAVLMATHDPSHAAYADRVLRLRDGAITGSPAENRSATAATTAMGQPIEDQP